MQSDFIFKQPARKSQINIIHTGPKSFKTSKKSNLMEFTTRFLPYLPNFWYGSRTILAILAQSKLNGHTSAEKKRERQKDRVQKKNVLTKPRKLSKD